MRLLQETNSGGTTQATYTLAPMGGQWEPLISHQKSGASRWYAFDALGTTRALTADSQLPTAVWTDDAWGNVLNATDPAASPHQYVGRLGYYLDGASGLQLLTQRYYDSGVGRFVSEDPVRDGQLWWGYADASPHGAADPAGERAGPPGCPDAIRELPPGYEWKDMPLTKNGLTECEPETGNIIIYANKDTFKDSTSCKFVCVAHHEEQHKRQLADCCRRLHAIWGSRWPRPRTQASEEWDEWVRANQDVFECEAYRASKRCLVDEMKWWRCSGWRCPACGRLRLPFNCRHRRCVHECCDELVGQFDSDLRNESEYCARARGRRVTPCPF